MYKCTYENTYQVLSTYKLIYIFGSTYESTYECLYVRFIAQGSYMS